MAKLQVGIPSGMRDFSPQILQRREYIFSTLRAIFSRYGYQPIETPTMELLETLLGKYGEEGDRLLYRVLNSGDCLRGVDVGSLSEPGAYRKVANQLCEKGLRYDLTVPFARYVVQHWAEIHLPFKRYQMQPVWRADRPQRGRYREFYQCDIDVVGSNSLLNEVEIVEIVRDVFDALGLKVRLLFNHRQLLAAISSTLGCSESQSGALMVAIDKLEKIGLEGTRAELAGGGLSESQITRLESILRLQGSPEERLSQLEGLLAPGESARVGLFQSRELLRLVRSAGVDIPVELDLSLARGLNYYTGAIFEVKSTEAEMGSICGGGRYDNLTGIFGRPGVSGIGISFGADRIYDVLDALGRFPMDLSQSVDLLCLNLDDEAMGWMLGFVRELREHGNRATIYPERVKLKKQLDYADRIGARWVAIIGEDEWRGQQVALKCLETRTQEVVPMDQAVRWLRAVAKL